MPQNVPGNKRGRPSETTGTAISAPWNGRMRFAF
jgi:hypothetical protein